MKKCLAEILVLMMILTLTCGAWAEGLIIEEDWTDIQAIAAAEMSVEVEEDAIMSVPVELTVPDIEDDLQIVDNGEIADTYPGFGNDNAMYAVYSGSNSEFTTSQIQDICNQYGFATGKYWSYSSSTGNASAYTASDYKATTTTSTNRGNPGYSDYVGYSFAGGSECWAFAGFIGYKLSGYTNPYDNSWKKYTSIDALNEVGGIAIGDLIRTNNHSAIVYSIDDAGTLKFAQCAGGANNYIAINTNFNNDSSCTDLASIVSKYGLSAIYRSPNNEVSKKDYTLYSYENTTYTVKQGFNLKSAPFEDSDVVRTVSKGSNVTAKKVVVNKYDNVWIELDGGGFAFGGLKLSNNSLSESGTQYLSYSGDNASISISGENIPSGNLSEGAGFELKGNITSSNSIHSVTAEVYSGSSKVATSDVWYSGNKTTTSLNIQPSIVNTTLKFGKLSPGNYTFKLNVTYYYNRSTQTATKTIRSSDFSIVGGSNPDPAPAPATDDKWVYRVKTSDGLNMRNAAGTGGSIVATLWNPTTITVTKKQNSGNYTWGYGTSSDGHTGWVVVDNNWTELIPQPEHQPSDTTAPVISDIHATNVTSDGFTLSCTVSDDVGVTKVEFPTWTEQNGQDDLIWHSGTLSGNTASFTLNVSEHNYERDCNYITDIYAYDAAGNHGVKRAEIQIVSPKVEPSSVSLNKTSASMQIGATMRLSATVYPNGVDTTLQWASSNSSVVIVDSNGIVAAVGKGTASITVTTENGLTDTCEVTVTQPKKVKGFKLVAGRKQITVVWTQASGVSGYQIEYSTSSKFTNAKRVKVGRGTKIETGKAVKKVIKSLKTKKTYYVRIRAYKKVNNVNYYSDWSKVLKKKTK